MIGNRLRKYRGVNGAKSKRSIRDVAEKSGLGVATICDLENGKVRITWKSAKALAPLLRVSPATLCAEADRHASK